MNKYGKKLAAVLAGVMVVSSLSAGTVFAAKNTVTKNPEVKIVKEAPVTEQRLNYVYVESPHLKAPAKQNIVVSWGDGTEDIENMRIVVQKENGTTEEWKSVKNIKETYLFSKRFSKNDRATFKVTKVKFDVAGETQEFDLKSINKEHVEFGVNKEYRGFDESLPELGETLSKTASTAPEVSVMSLNENGKVKEVNSVEDALEEAAENIPKAMSVSLFSVPNQRKEMILAFDPGHDKSHGGAKGNEAYEAELCLKIATFCKEIIEKNDGIRVIMTRETAECPYPGTKNSECLKRRVQDAAKAGAQYFISFHINDSTNTAANGATVIHPNKNWKPEIGEAGKQLAQCIQDELVALGLKDRKIFDKSTKEDTYEDGSKRDYYSIIRNSKENGMPGIIIEHAFIKNKSDYEKFLKTEEGLKKLANADATGIMKFLKSVEQDNQGNTDNSGTSGNTDDKDEVTKPDVDDKDEGTKPDTDVKPNENKDGWITENGKKFYYVKGVKTTGQKKINKKWYLFDETTGEMLTGIQEIKKQNKRVYYGPEGDMKHGQYKINGKWYLFDKVTGAMKTGIQRIKKQNKTVYYGPEGDMKHGQYKINGKWYLFDKVTGAMKTGLCKIKGQNKTVYYGPDGAMRYGKQKINGKWYTFHRVTGALISRQK